MPEIYPQMMSDHILFSCHLCRQGRNVLQVFWMVIWETFLNRVDLEGVTEYGLYSVTHKAIGQQQSSLQAQSGTTAWFRNRFSCSL